MLFSNSNKFSLSCILFHNYHKKRELQQVRHQGIWKAHRPNKKSPRNREQLPFVLVENFPDFRWSDKSKLLIYFVCYFLFFNNFNFASNYWFLLFLFFNSLNKRFIQSFLNLSATSICSMHLLWGWLPSIFSCLDIRRLIHVRLPLCHNPHLPFHRGR